MTFSLTPLPTPVNLNLEKRRPLLLVKTDDVFNTRCVTRRRSSGVCRGERVQKGARSLHCCWHASGKTLSLFVFLINVKVQMRHVLTPDKSQRKKEPLLNYKLILASKRKADFPWNMSPSSPLWWHSSSLTQNIFKVHLELKRA